MFKVCVGIVDHSEERSKALKAGLSEVTQEAGVVAGQSLSSPWAVARGRKTLLQQIERPDVALSRAGNCNNFCIVLPLFQSSSWFSPVFVYHFMR